MDHSPQDEVVGGDGGGGKRKAPFYTSLVCRTCADPSPQPAGLEVASEVVKTEVQWTIPLGMRWLAVNGGEGSEGGERKAPFYMNLVCSFTDHYLNLQDWK